MDILQQDRRESAEQRQELCEIITRLQGELQNTEEQRDKVSCQWVPLQNVSGLWIVSGGPPATQVGQTTLSPFIQYLKEKT